MVVLNIHADAMPYHGITALQWYAYRCMVTSFRTTQRCSNALGHKYQTRRDANSWQQLSTRRSCKFRINNDDRAQNDMTTTIVPEKKELGDHFHSQNSTRRQNAQGNQQNEYHPKKSDTYLRYNTETRTLSPFAFQQVNSYQSLSLSHKITNPTKRN